MPWPDMADRMLGVAVRTFGHSDRSRQTRIVYVPKTGNPYEIVAVFDSAYLSVETGGEVAVSSVSPVVGVQLSQLRAPVAKGDRVQVDSVIYRISDQQPDGVAGALLKLQET